MPSTSWVVSSADPFIAQPNFQNLTRFARRSPMFHSTPRQGPIFPVPSLCVSCRSGFLTCKLFEHALPIAHGASSTPLAPIIRTTRVSVTPRWTGGIELGYRTPVRTCPSGHLEENGASRAYSGPPGSRPPLRDVVLPWRFFSAPHQAVSDSHRLRFHRRVSLHPVVWAPGRNGHSVARHFYA